MNKKLLVICPYPQGVAPSQRLKYEQYFDAFRQDGWAITVAPFIDNSFWQIIYKKGFLLSKMMMTVSGYLRRIILLFTISRYHVVYVHLWTTPFGPPFYEWMVRKLARRLIYDIDDLVYLSGTKSQAHPIVNLVKGRKKPIYLMRHADHVITCTPFLDEFVRRFNARTTDISSTVDTTYRYKVVNNYTNDKKITIGWSGSLTTSKYFYLLTDVFKKLKEHCDFRVLVMGDDTIRIEGVEVEALAWKESYEMEVLQQFDIGVYPIPDEPWVYGKSGLKAIQYMALGVPTVASAIGANFRVIEQGISGFLVRNESEWIRVLTQLVQDAELRRKVGLEGRKRVVELFSIEANKETYLGILNGKN